MYASILSKRTEKQKNKKKLFELPTRAVGRIFVICLCLCCATKIPLSLPPGGPNERVEHEQKKGGGRNKEEARAAGKGELEISLRGGWQKLV